MGGWHGYFKAFKFGPIQLSAEFTGTFPNPLLGSNTLPYIIETKCKKCGTTHSFLKLDDMSSGGQTIMR